MQIKKPQLLLSWICSTNIERKEEEEELYAFQLKRFLYKKSLK